MNSIIKRKTVLIGITMLVIAIVAFTSVNAFLTSSKPAIAADDQPVTTAATIEEATRLAGYEVFAPSFVPSQFNSASKITVHKTTNSNLSKRVMQTWSSVEKDFFFYLIQDPKLSGIGGGEKAEVGGVQGQRKYTAATPDRPAILSLYWQKGDMAFVLTGTLKGGLDEETLSKVVGSVGVSK